MSRAYGTREKEEKSVQVWWENLKERNKLKDLSLDVKMTLKRILKKQSGELLDSEQGPVAARARITYVRFI
jgi:hypothetical protein